MNAINIWQDFLKIVTEEVGSRVVETWFKSVSLSHWDSSTGTVYLQAPNLFIKDWILNHYSKLLQTHLGRLLNRQALTIIFLDESRTAVKSTPHSTAVKAPTVEKPKKIPANPLVNSRYEFESFVVGPNNLLAYKAAQAVAKEPGRLYNPLFIHGAPGLGKTHLLHAVANKIKQVQPKARILYQSADRFVHEFISSVRFDKAAAFEKRYKDIDVFLVDDIQLISHKEQTQEAFFQIYNALYESQKQIIFSSDTLPSEIEGLSGRLQSRFDGGLVTDLQPPTLETKIEILQKKAFSQQGKLSDDVAEFIASKVSTNVRELEGLLIRVLAFATLTHQAVSLELAHKILQKTTVELSSRPSLGLPKIAHKIAKHYNYSITEMRSAKRQKNLTLARHVAMYCMKKNTDHSLIDIATFWCRKDHSTVSHALEKIRAMSKKDVVFQQELEQIDQLLHS